MKIISMLRRSFSFVLISFLVLSQPFAVHAAKSTPPHKDFTLYASFPGGHDLTSFVQLVSYYLRFGTNNEILKKLQAGTLTEAELLLFDKQLLEAIAVSGEADVAELAKTVRDLSIKMSVDHLARQQELFMQHDYSKQLLAEKLNTKMQLLAEQGKQQAELLAKKMAEKKLLQKDAQEHALKMMHEKFTELKAVMSQMGNGVMTFAQDKEALRNVALVIGGTIATYFILKRATKVIGDHIAAKLKKPSLIRETSWRHPLQKIQHAAGNVWHLVRGAKKPHMVEPIFNEELEQQLGAFKRSTELAAVMGLHKQNALFYGPPGTGKTLFATHLARTVGMDYAIVAGSDFDQFEKGEGIAELHKLFDWAESTPKGVVLFIDEADAFLAKRSTMDEKGRKLLNAFLQRTGTQSSKIMLVCATNSPDLLDKAVLDRCDKALEFKNPELQERVKIITAYLKQFFHYEKIAGYSFDTAYLTPAVIAGIAVSTEGFSGRALSKLMLDLRSQMIADTKTKVDRVIVARVVAQAVAQYKETRNLASCV